MKKLFPIILALCVAGAWISLLTRDTGGEEEYEMYITNAHTAYENEYYLEALKWLDSVEGLEEIPLRYEEAALKRDCYLNLGEDSSYLSQCLRMVEDYPEVEENYLLVIGYYQENGNERRLYQYLPLYAERFPENEALKQIVSETDKQYTYVRRGYFDVRYATASLVDVQTAEFSKDAEGENVIQRRLQNSSTTVFDRGYAAMEVAQSGSSCFVMDQDGVWTRVDIAGRLLAQNKEVSFEAIGRLSRENIAKALIDGKYHFINEKMKVSSVEWEDAGTFYNGVNTVKKNGKWAIIGTGGWEAVTEFPYRDVARNSMDVCSAVGLCVVADEKGYYIVDAVSLQPVSEQVYEELKAFESAQPTAYRSGDKWGFVNNKGEIFIEAAYEDAKSFMNGYAAVRKDGLWGYIDRHGTMIIEPQFQDALPVMNNGVAYVQDADGYWDSVRIDKLYYTAD